MLLYGVRWFHGWVGSRCGRAYKWRRSSYASCGQGAMTGPRSATALCAVLSAVWPKTCGAVERACEDFQRGVDYSNERCIPDAMTSIVDQHLSLLICGVRSSGLP